MKRILALLALEFALGLFFCRRWSNPLDPKNNRPPLTPSAPSPGDSATRQDTNTVLTWVGGDPDSGDIVAYDVYFGSTNQPPLAQAGLDTNAWPVRGLSFATVYYWRVISRDLAGHTTPGPIWSFTTRAENDSNRPPYTPSQPSPQDGATGQDTGVVLTWTGGDPDSGDVVRYDIYFGSSSPPMLVRSGHGSTTYDPGNLGFLTRYYWRVVARDKAGDSAVGPVWSFTTRAVTDTNRPPLTPSNPTPESGATSQSIRTILSWTCSDPDSGDTVRYDVYFGSTSSPSRVSQNQIGTTYTPGTLAYETDYYWRVVARDNHAAEKGGPLWRFRTISRIVVTSPAAGELWLLGSAQSIEWTGGTCRTGDHEPRYSSLLLPAASYSPNFGTDSTVIYYSIDNGTTWIRHGRATEPGRYNWVVPGPETDSARIQVRVFTGRDTTIGTSAVFRMLSLPTPITITVPSETTRWREGSSQTIEWTGGTRRAGNNEPRFSFLLLPAASCAPPLGTDSTVIYYSIDNGATWTRHGRATETGHYDWTVPGPATTNARIKVRVFLANWEQIGTSPTYTVYDSLAPSAITVTAPVPGARWHMRTLQLVTWTGGTDGMDSTVIYYSSNGGTEWQRQGRTSRPAEFTWLVPGPETDSARIQVRAYCGQSQTSGTSGLFTVAPSFPDSVVATVPTGRAPAALCWNSATDRVYVSNRDSDTVTVIDGRSNSVIARVKVGDQPGALVFNPIGNKVYVANEGSSSVTVIDGSNNSVLRTIAVGTQPHALAWNATNNKVYCANWSSNTVSIIDANRDTVIATLSTGSRPASVCWNWAANKAYVACAGSNEVTIVDGVNNSVITTLPVSPMPCYVVADTIRNLVYVASQSANKVTVIDGQTNMTTTVISVPAAPCFLVFNPESRKLYTASRDADSVGVLNTQTLTLIATVKAGDEPHALTWTPFFNVVYVVSSASDDVTIIGGVSNRAEGLVRVQDQPVAACWNPTDRKVYVANYTSGTVTIIGIRAWKSE